MMVIFMEKEKYLEAGKIVNTHGVRGEVKIMPGQILRSLSGR